MKLFAILTVVVITAIGTIQNANAQGKHQNSTGVPQQRLLVAPPTQSPPKLGVSGQIYANWGFKIKSVQPGSAAHRMGLERGDVIKSINDVGILSMNDLRTALSESRMYYNSRVRLTVDNVRARKGLSNQRIVTVRGNLAPEKKFYTVNGT